MPHDPPVAVEHRIGEPRRVPWLGLVMGLGAMLPFPAAAAAAWLLPGGTGPASLAAVLWGGGLLCFLAGVRRGLSFRTVGGPTVAQIATTLWLFLAGIAALALPWPVAALALLAAGFASLAVLDPRAAGRGEVPLYFAGFRPWQMAIPAVSLLALLARVAMS